MGIFFSTKSGKAKPKPNRPWSVSADKELSNMISEQTMKLKKTLPPEHFALYDILKHKQPSKMAHIIANKFAEFYPDEPNLEIRA